VIQNLKKHELSTDKMTNLLKNIFSMRNISYLSKYLNKN